MLTESLRFERECERKRAYRSAAAARRWQIGTASRHGPGVTKGLEPYECTWCEQWHLGHPNKAKWLAQTAPDGPQAA